MRTADSKSGIIFLLPLSELAHACEEVRITKKSFWDGEMFLTNVKENSTVTIVRRNY